MRLVETFLVETDKAEIFFALLVKQEAVRSTWFLHLQIRVGEEYVSNGNFTSYTLFAIYPGPYTAAQDRLSCVGRAEGVRGRFVSIQKVKAVAGSTYLQIVDVNVFVLKRNWADVQWMVDEVSFQQTH